MEIFDREFREWEAAQKKLAELKPGMLEKVSKWGEQLRQLFCIRCSRNKR